MRQESRLALAMIIVSLAGCVADTSYDPGYGTTAWQSAFIDDDWLYYDEDDEDFLAGLSDEQKQALKKRWDELSPEEKQAIRDRWNNLTDSQRDRVREAWRGLDAGQRQEVMTNMEGRLRSGRYGSVPLVQPGSSGRSLDRSGMGAGGGSFGQGGFGGGRGMGGGGRGGGGGRR